jgi:hypothetical protein
MGCHTPPAQPSAAIFEAGIPEICPPGEGTVLQIGNIFRETKQVF